MKINGIGDALSDLMEKGQNRFAFRGSDLKILAKEFDSPSQEKNPYQDSKYNQY
jgi:hypothetical protein